MWLPSFFLCMIRLLNGQKEFLMKFFDAMDFVETQNFASVH